jgi:hypothetical protein
MRPLRFLLALATCIIGFFFLLFIGPFRANTQEDLEERSSISTYFNWRGPSSLFPPSAIISLTDDNSTFFLARPAAFGPLLPSKSLSGQLWVGSGFGDDHLGHGRGAGSDGELGCSDIPEWDGASYRSSIGGKKTLGDGTAATEDVQDGKRKRSLAESDDEKDGEEQPTEDDGTDDHLHHPLPPSDGLKSNGESAGTTKKPTHADIQSLQEGAEIAGKIVLLSRGGCGFLEKVKWVQRRGGVALIVGDDIRGGPLVTMYARGDTSNVTIPSLFTSHTTAHLLSSLIPSGGALGDISAEEAARLGLVFGDKADSSKDKSVKAGDKPNFTTTSAALKATATPKTQQKDGGNAAGPVQHVQEQAASENKAGWFSSLFGGGSSSGGHRDSRRPPSSGNIGWVLQEDFDEKEDLPQGKTGKHAITSTSSAAAATKTSTKSSGDGFVIGVQDWRDPDLVAAEKERQQASTSTSISSTSSVTPQSSVASKNDLKGGSITPGSGEYGKAIHEAVDIGTATKQKPKGAAAKDEHAGSSHKSGGWFSRLFGSNAIHIEVEARKKKSEMKVSDQSAQQSKADSHHRHHQKTDNLPKHDGLWVTLTPTSMSSSPFFDTLLVLVVSPLVTLTVVYALLLLRSRIRRRRWRAPKSVVERLPVRTYQTMPSSSSSSTTSSVSSPISVTTPLLPSGTRPINTRSRPRARTASYVPAHPSSSLRSDEMAPPSLEQIEEKRAAGLAEWRRRYGGKQRECVVCLEEYVDGVSRVMSLPCGHEFHAECM